MDERDRPGPAGSTRRLLRTVRADPRHMPELMAVFAVEFLGDQAAQTATDLRDPHATAPADAPDPAARVIRTGVHRSVVEGAFLGGPFMLLLPIAFCAALLAQLRMLLELSALAGRDPRDRALAADLLVIQGVYADLVAAESGLREASKASPGAGVRAGWWDTVRRQAYLLGLLAPEDQPRGRLRRAAGWAGIGALVLVGLVLPFVWVPACGEMYRRATGRLARRTAAYFALDRDRAAGPAVEERFALRPGALLVAVRTLVVCLLSAGTLLMVLLTDLNDFGSQWWLAVLILFAAAAIDTALWYRRRQ
ncbi:uncharacterized membrane protein YhaH (DUF805 family) [Kitasatospora sp. MAP12-15]|uniref:hypothetical protein n=1 Tax=unclassified Kitasatospora TaxID=2633591 RepID=UPI0024772AE8|nr:hypothetical protein [Kitasatospora sp. MAP12-44]MDH6108253.1 uncharacterized membrane protein YhaH (DUF805 family) [Kitasatospora sp. MAP12-44]